jgi:hypothetical protein
MAPLAADQMFFEVRLASGTFFWDILDLISTRVTSEKDAQAISLPAMGHRVPLDCKKPYKIQDHEAIMAFLVLIMGIGHRR